MHAATYFCYIIASQINGTLYIGVTNNLLRRIAEHKQGLTCGFSKKYHIHQLVWYEVHQEIASALLREKQLKKWHRQWKIRLIEETNPEWVDLYPSLLG